MATAAGGRLLAGETRRGDAAEMKQVAERLESDNPGWIVVYGVFTREFVAFPRFRAPVAMLTATYPAALPPRMRAIEATVSPTATGQEPEAEPADTVMFRPAG